MATRNNGDAVILKYPPGEVFTCPYCYAGQSTALMKGSGVYKLHSSLSKHLKVHHPSSFIKWVCSECNFSDSGGYPFKAVKLHYDKTHAARQSTLRVRRVATTTTTVTGRPLPAISSRYIPPLSPGSPEFECDRVRVPTTTTSTATTTIATISTTRERREAIKPAAKGAPAPRRSPALQTATSTTNTSSTPTTTTTATTTKATYVPKERSIFEATSSPISLYLCSLLGITAGAHRLWSHRSYKAKWPLQMLLVIFNTIAHQNSAIDWVRDHRLHHKYSETDADPHNAKNGFFFAHVGLLLCKRHPDIAKKGKDIDLSDLRNNPLLMFQKKYYMYLMPLFCFILPTVIPVYCWDETWSNAYFVPTVLRYVFTLNVTWLVNSAAHLFGNKPYDRHINPSENKMVSITALGEGWHDCHHVFPWDYKAAELGNYGFNFTTAFIDFFAKLGLAYDLKTVPKDIVQKRMQRTGDGSRNTANR